MYTTRLTEERLRTWAISQDDRERMCLGILALDVRFSNVKPRRPKGGPDGGRDIEALFDNREVVSEAEQAAFFAEYGSQIETLLHKGFGAIDERLKRIEFFHDCSKPLLELVSGIYVVANDYVLAGADSEFFVPLDMGTLVPWPEPLTEAEASVPWVTVMLKIPNPPSWMIPELARTGWDVNFSHYTPQKVMSE